MIGNNSIIFNTATMMEALQEYLDKRMGKYAPSVRGVTSESQSNGTFKISLSDKESLE